MSVSGLYNGMAESALRFQGNHQSKVGDANSSLASGLKSTKASRNPSDQAIAIQLDSLTNVLDQASTNAANLASVIQVATGAINGMQGVLSKMDALAAKANADDIDSTTRAQVNEEFTTLRDFVTTIANRTRWNGVALLTGGAGSVSVAGAAAASGTIVASATHANSFATGITAESKGMISGQAVSSNVVKVGDGDDMIFSVTLRNGDKLQTFESGIVTPADGTTMTLMSKTDNRNSIEVTFAADTGDIETTALLAQAQVAWSEALGLNAGAVPAQIKALSTAANNGVGTISVASNVPVGEYALVKDAGAASTLNLIDASGKVYEATAASDGAQSVSFDNGVTVALGAGYVAATAITQMVFDVGAGTSASLTSQVGELSTDTQQVNFTAATGSALQISSATVDTKANAAIASTLIKSAIATLNQTYAKLGAQQINLEATQENVAITSENLKAAMSGYKDANIAEEVAKSAVASAMVDVAGVAISKALMESQRAAKIANAV